MTHLTKNRSFPRQFFPVILLASVEIFWIINIFNCVNKCMYIIYLYCNSREGNIHRLYHVRTIDPIRQQGVVWLFRHWRQTRF